MNILPHKSWHVWKRDNIEKVERDEAKHKKELEEQRQKELALERKKRFEQLKGVDPEEKNTPAPSIREEEPKREHFSLFSDLEKKYAVEKKKAQKQNEELIQKMDGACPLGKCSAETMKVKPWYQRPAFTNCEDEPTTPREKRKKRNQERAKRGQDPMAEVKRSLAKRQREDSNPKLKKHAKQDRLATLREQRLQREQIERQRANELIRHKRKY